MNYIEFQQMRKQAAGDSSVTGLPANGPYNMSDRSYDDRARVRNVENARASSPGSRIAGAFQQGMDNYSNRIQNYMGIKPRVDMSKMPSIRSASGLEYTAKQPTDTSGHSFPVQYMGAVGRNIAHPIDTLKKGIGEFGTLIKNPMAINPFTQGLEEARLQTRREISRAAQTGAKGLWNGVSGAFAKAAPAAAQPAPEYVPDPENAYADPKFNAAMKQGPMFFGKGTIKDTKGGIASANNARFNRALLLGK